MLRNLAEDAPKLADLLPNRAKMLLISVQRLLLKEVLLRHPRVSEQKREEEARMPAVSEQNFVEERSMAATMSTESLLAELEKQLAHHRQREAFHAEQESAHRERRERHAEEAARIAQTAETLRASLTTALGLVAPALAEQTRDQDMDTGHIRILSRLLNRVIEGKSGAERFGAVAVTEEVNRRFANILRQPATQRQIALALRRQARKGRIHQVRRGRPHHEALYVRELR
jgi:hypothetical protein